MQAFEYASPTSKEAAVKLLASEWGETEVLAGGTDLLSLMKDQGSAPKRVVSLAAVKELKAIEYNPSTGLRLGALVTLRELLDSAEVRKPYPALIEAAEGVRSPQLHSMGTVGGDLLQRPRCWYYRGGYGLLAQMDGKSLVPDGENQYHAILGNSGPAYFVNPSSFAPILIALGAKVRLFGPGGARDVSLDKFYGTPTSADQREYDLKPNEILTDILVPAAGGAKMAVYEVRQKEALDWPLAAAAVVLNLDGKTVKSARVVLGHVAPTPWPSPEAEAALAGKTVSESVAEEAGKAALAKATPLSKNAYKVQLARVAVKRAVLAAAEGGA
ncbi:MAG: FAD binding domain-containing protein [Acidobacteriia bacterium]|nr:FAD binding domain-containing protein [Terriglobia bacterium]